MTAGTERALLTRAHELADTADLAGRLIEIIGWARAARVDQAALAGLVTAVRHLGGDVTALFRAVRGRRDDGGGGFGRDTELLEAAEDAGGDIAARARAVAQLRRQAEQALQEARDDAEDAGDADGDTAQWDLDEAREREDLAAAAIEVLAPLPRKLAAALQAVSRLPDDLHDTYAAAYDLVTADPKAMPRDGDFITGETSPAAMAAKMLAARARPPDPVAPSAAGRAS